MKFIKFGKVAGLALVTVPIVGASSLAVAAADVSEFYSNKTIKMIVAGGAGGPYGTYSHLIKPFFEKYMPGSPTVVIQFMVGAGGAKAANYIYNVLPRDGAGTGMLLNNFALAARLRGNNLKYDPTKFSFLAGAAITNSVIVVKRSAGVQTLADLRTKEIVLSAAGKTGTPSICPTVTKAVTGARLKVVLGYPGLGHMAQAVDSGEAQGLCGAWESIAVARPHWFEKTLVVPLVTLGMKRSPEFPDVPVLLEFADSEEDRQLVSLVSEDSVLGRLFVAPPGVPADRLDTLREALYKSLRDPALIATAKKRSMKMELVEWERIQRAVERIYNTDEKIVVRLKGLLGPDG